MAKGRDSAVSPRGQGTPRADAGAPADDDIRGEADAIEQAALARLRAAARREDAEAAGRGSTLQPDAGPLLIPRAADAREHGRRRPLATEPGAELLAEEQDDVISVINELSSELERYQHIRETLEAKLLAAGDALRDANKRIQELEWQAVALQARVDSVGDMRQEMTGVEDELAGANERAHHLNQELEQQSREATRLADELRSANRQLEELWGVRAERDEVRAEVERLQAEEQERQRALAELHAERDHLHSQLQETQATLREVRTDRHKKELDLRTAHDRIEKMQRVQETLGEKLVLLRTEKRDLHERVERLDDEAGRLGEEKRAIEYELGCLRDRNQHATEVIARARRVFGDVRLALSKTRGRSRQRSADIWPQLDEAMRTATGPPDGESGPG